MFPNDQQDSGEYLTEPLHLADLKQHVGDKTAAPVDHDLAEVDRRLDAGPVGLRVEHVDRAAAGLRSDLRLPRDDVSPPWPR